MARAQIPAAVRTQISVDRGEPLPLGLRETADGFNFAVFSRNGSRVTLLFFDGVEPAPFQTIVLDPDENRTGDVWHVHLRGDLQGKNYVLRVDGPWSPDEGHRFDSRLPLLDPYASALVSSAQLEAVDLSRGQVDGSSDAFARGLVHGDHFDWENDKPPHHAWQGTIIYETRIRSLHQAENSSACLLVRSAFGLSSRSGRPCTT